MNIMIFMNCILQRFTKGRDAFFLKVLVTTEVLTPYTVLKAWEKEGFHGFQTSVI